MALAEQGCRRREHHDFQELESRGERHRRFMREHFYHDVLTDRGGNRLEMHWRLSSNVEECTFDHADLFGSGDTIAVGGDSVAMMAPVPLLLYLCDHGARHGWCRLKWLADLPQVLESHAWDWPEVLTMAKRTNCLAALLLGLKLAQALFGWRAPASVAAAMKKQLLLDWQVRMVCRSLDKTELDLATPTVLQRLTHLAYRASMVESAGFVWQELAYYFMSDHDLRIVRLPDRWFRAYYVLRPMLVWLEIFRHWQARQAK